MVGIMEDGFQEQTHFMEEDFGNIKVHSHTL
jgi:hypothetical protein